MASIDRKAAKDAIQTNKQDDPELSSAIADAHKFQLELAKENNRHAEKIRAQDLGWVGRLLGGEKTAPTVIALFVMIVCFIGAFFAWNKVPSNNSLEAVEATHFWGTQAERAISFAGAALAYIFGRGMK